MRRADACFACSRRRSGARRDRRRRRQRGPGLLRRHGLRRSGREDGRLPLLGGEANAGSTTVFWPEAGIGWNVNGRWYTEVLGELDRLVETSPAGGNVQLAERRAPDAGPVSVRPGGAHAAGAAADRPQARARDRPGVPDRHRPDPARPQRLLRARLRALAGPTELAYQWQLRHRWNRWLHFGAQGFGELGPWDQWLPQDQQSHRAGPALFGSLPLGPGRIGWQAACLSGKTYARRGEMLTVRVKYDF